MWWLSVVACWFSRPSAPSCDEPHLWYAPDTSGDVYFGCDQPAGWLVTPPDETIYTVVLSETQTEPDEESLSWISASEPTEDPNPPTDTAEVPEPRRDATQETGLPENPIDTADFDTNLDTADTGDWPVDAPRPEDTGDLPPETGLLEETGQDTGALPPEGVTGETGL